MSMIDFYSIYMKKLKIQSLCLKIDSHDIYESNDS